jgi:hypothetical protein
MMIKKLLRQRCKEKGLKNYYKLTKYELIALLNSEFTEEFYNAKEHSEKQQQEQQEHPEEHPEDNSEDNLDELFIQENYYETKKEVYNFLQTACVILSISAMSAVVCIIYLL